MRRPRRFRDLPLVAQVLIPFLALMLVVGGLGVVAIVRDLNSRGQTALEHDLSRRLLDARSSVRDHELSLVESANLASNLEGMASRLRAGDRNGVATLARSVLALKTELHLLAVTDRRAVPFVEFRRSDAGAAPVIATASDWPTQSLLTEVLGRAEKASGFVEMDGRRYLAVAAPICPPTTECTSAGAAVVGIDVSALVEATRSQATDLEPPLGVAVFDTAGAELARSGAVVGAADAREGTAVVQRTAHVDGIELSTGYTAFKLQGKPAGILAVTLPTQPAFASARGTGIRLAMVVVAVMAGIIALGVFLSRSILAQVKPLVETNRALGDGDLSARAVVLGEGELGELAAGVNQMAEQLQALYGDLEQRVEDRTAEVRRLLKERTEFFASISHELRTPLAVILGQGKMMLDPKYPKTQRWATGSGRVIVETTNQLITVVNEILELARADAGQLEMDLEPVDVGEVLRELAPTVERLASDSDVHLSVVQPLRRVMVRADRRRLHGILLNLVDNAIKYTPQGGAVTVTTAVRGASATITVEDTGIGIPAGVGDLIFEPFFRVEGSPVRQGQASSGLGLALCKRVVEAHGGSLSYQTAPGDGTVFTVRLPRAAARRATHQRGSVAGA